MAGIGAANIWNPLGWATLAATGIGAGVSYLSKRRKARKAGDAMDEADDAQDADVARIKKDQRLEGLKNKQYSGFDYGGDNKGPGFYKGGGIKYQSTGVKDVLAEPEGFQNPYGYNPSSRNDDIRAQNNREVNTNQIQTDETGLPTNRYTPSDNMSMEDIQRIIDSQGSIPLPEAEVTGNFVPQDIPTGSDPYSNNSMEQKIFDNLGMDGVLEYRQNTSNQHAATAPFGNVASTVLAGGSLGGSSSNLVKAPIQKYGTSLINNAKSAYTGLNAAGETLSTGARVTSGIKSAIAGSSLQQLPAKAYGIGSGVVQEAQGEGNVESRLRVAANLTSFLPGVKQLQATLGNSGPTVKDGIKIAKDVKGGYYGNALMRTGLSFLKGDQNKFVDKINPEALAFTKASVSLGAKQGIFKNALNYSDNSSKNMLGTPPTEMREGGMRLPGGKAIDLGNGATKYVGQTHKQGGIYPDPQSEVENDEIEAPVTLADGSTNPYIFSEYLNTDGSKGYNDGGESIASVAEGLATNGAPQSKFDQLATEQEKLAGRSGDKIMNTTMAKYGGFQDTSNYKDGGVTKYQTKGVMLMSKEREEQYMNLIKFLPQIGYVAPDGTRLGFDEQDAVNYVNRGALDSYNTNQGNNYMPSEEAMDQYGLEGRQQAFRDALQGNRQPGPSNEATADPNFRRGQQGDLVVPPNTTPTTIDPGNQDFNAINALGDQQRQQEAAQQQQETQASEAEIDRVQAESAAREEAEAAAAEIPRSSIPAVGTEARRQYYDDNNWAYDNTIPGQGNYSSPPNYGDAESDPFGMVPSGLPEDLRTTSGLDTPMFGGDPGVVETTAEAGERSSAVDDLAAFEEKKDQEAYDELSAKDKRQLKRDEKRGGREAGDGRLLKAAQFIPAAMAFMDKPDYMENPQKVGGIDRVNLENVSLNDRQAAIKSDNAAMQRFISNAGMGSAGFAARMAGWQKKEGLAAAVTAEQRRMNTEINNREATMNVDVDARNKAIQGENINRSMRVDQFNTESEAATKMQKVNAMATATQGLLTQFMDKQRIDADDRRTTAIAGQTGVMDREGYGIQTDRHFKGTGVTAQDDAYWDYYDKLGNTEKVVKKFGGMRKIPSYGYSK